MTTTQSDSESYLGIDDLTVYLTDGVLSVTLNRPDSLNSLTAAMLTTIGSTLRAGGHRPAGQGGPPRRCRPRLQLRRRASAKTITPTPGPAEHPADVLAAANQAVRAIVELPKPVVAVVHGPAAGVGVSLALACDVVLASEKAYFLLAFTKIGLMPDGGASALVAASIGRTRAMRMALLAERLPAADAFDVGLVSAVYPADELDAAVDGSSPR